MNKVIITKVKTDRQSVNVNEKMKIQVWAYSAVDNEKIRLPFNLGGGKNKT